MQGSSYLRRGRHRALIAVAGSALLASGTALPVAAAPGGGNKAQVSVASGPFTVIADDYSFGGVPQRIKAVNGLTTVTLDNNSPEEHHEIVFVRLKDERQNLGFTIPKAKQALAESFNFEAQADAANVGGFTPGFPSAPTGLRDPTMGGRADVYKTSFGGTKTHEVEAVPPATTESNGVDLSRPGRYLFFCPITALAQNDPHQEPHYLQTPGQIGFLEVVA